MIKKSVRCLILPVLLLSIGLCANAHYLKHLRNYKKVKKHIVPVSIPVTISEANTFKAVVSLSICSGTSATIPGDIPTPAGTFIWQVLNAANNWVTAPGVNSGADYITATLSNVVNTPQIYSFRRSIRTALGTTYDSYYDVTVNPKTAIATNQITAPPAVTLCVNSDPDVITGSAATGGDGVTYNYQWQQSTNGGANFTDIPGAIGVDYDPPVLSSTTVYQRKVTSGVCNPPSVSNKVTITILKAITNNQIYNPATVFYCIRGIPSIINGNIPSGGTGTFRYQWQNSADGVNFTDLPGNNATRQDYDHPALTTTTYYRRGAISGACTIPSYSNVVTIVIQPGLSNNSIFAPDCPIGGVVIKGTAAAGGIGVYAYQWQSSPDGGRYTNIPGTDAQNQDYQLPATTGTTYYQRLVTSGACTIPLVSNQIFVIVSSAVSGNTITAPAITAFCSSGIPGPITGTIPTGGASYTYIWQSAVNGGPFTDIPNSNLQNFDPQTITQTTTYRRGVMVPGCNTPIYSNAVTITIQPALNNNTIQAPSITELCESGSSGLIIGSTPTGGSGTYIYSWQSSVNGGPFIDIPNSNQQNFDPHTITQTTTYQRSVKSGLCNTPLVSNPVTIKVTPAITSNVINQPANAVYCGSSQPLTITTQLPAGGNGVYAYQWMSSTDNISYNRISNATNADYVVPALTVTTWFKRMVSSGACLNPLQSNPVVITVYQALDNNTITPPLVSSFCQSGNATPIAGSLPTGANDSYTYQWQQSSTNTAAAFTDISGQTSANFDPPNLTSTMFYRRVVMSSACTTSLISNIIEIHITPPVTSNSISAPVTSNCESVDPPVISGSIVQGGDGPGSYHYQWYSSTNNNTNWSLIPGATGIDYDPPVITTTTMFRRDVTSGICQVPLSSNTEKIVVNQIPANVSVGPVSPVCTGDMTTISVLSPNPTLSYIWYDSPAKNNILFTGPSYTAGPLAASQTFYVEASNGICTSLALASVPITVNPLPPGPVLVTNPVSTCRGGTPVLSILNPQQGYTYNWYLTPLVGSPIFTGPNFTLSPVNNNATYYVEAVNNVSGCVSFTPRTVVNVSITPPPTVTAKGTQVCPGETATLTTDNNDINVTINWYTSPTGGLSVFTGNNFITPPVNANTMYYAEAVSNSCVSATRSIARAEVIQPLQAPVVNVETALAQSLTFSWNTIPEATGYEVSTDGGQTFVIPSSGINGNTHMVTGLLTGQSITIIVRATGSSTCQLSNNSAPVTGTTVNAQADNIFVANAFTPNGDGKNDLVYVRNENIKSLKFYVYSQWGELLYTSQIQQKGWDGTFKGKTEPPGVYVYYLEAIINDGKQVKKKGTITLLR
ncbi:gliding motility-associated C-terminal domain-containing protein [Mucilaginibacter pocheonensis]|uniref:Gliding motility-associated-like protein n=1 Tax=Mucilaginibacter pocheonensis TaxID=398050 RepID=A0ABU1TH53_9SPHI|nr:gliding motility-associated C-terminal domain-containing protein [Mucilaginibacter pocheonensis]MDR6944713.1 gliding motility-associated-like protein [Mucilaginibacter pocheonensis]